MPKTKQFDKESVLDAASNIFRQRGYNGTSVDDILRVTGLSRSSLYDTFTDKHTLYIQALEYYKKMEMRHYEQTNDREMNGFEKIEYVFKEVVNHLVTKGDSNGCFMVNAAAEMSKKCEKTAAVVCNNKNSAEELFAGWLSDAQNHKIIPADKNPKEYSPFLFNSLCGLKVMSQSGATRTELNHAVQATLDALR